MKRDLILPFGTEVVDHLAPPDGGKHPIPLTRTRRLLQIALRTLMAADKDKSRLSALVYIFWVGLDREPCRDRNFSLYLELVK